LRPVENRLNFDAWRQGAANLVEPGIDRGGNNTAVAADQHQRRANDDLAAVFAGAAGANFAADLDRGHIADPHRNAIAGAQNDLLNVADAFEASSGSIRDAFAVALDYVGAPAAIVGLDSPNDVVKRQPEADKFHRVGLHLISLDVAPQGIDAGDTDDTLDPRTHDPVLYRAQISRPFNGGMKPFAFRRNEGVRHRRRRKSDRPHVDFAET